MLDQLKTTANGLPRHVIGAWCPAYLSPAVPGGAFLRPRLNQGVIHIILGGIAFLTQVQ